jgi:hypothetical protein
MRCVTSPLVKRFIEVKGRGWYVTIIEAFWFRVQGLDHKIIEAFWFRVQGLDHKIIEAFWFRVEG